MRFKTMTHDLSILYHDCKGNKNCGIMAEKTKVVAGQ